MARKSNLSNLAKQLSRKPTDLIHSAPSGSSERSLPIGNSGDAKRSSIGSKSTPRAIQFGRPSQSGSKQTASSGSAWTSLLKQTASGGIASAFTGGFGGIGGLGSLISGIFNLFGGGGGKNTLPPLTEFELPNSQQQTEYVSSKGASVYAGDAEVAGSSGSGGGIYKNAEQLQTSGSSTNAQWMQEQSGAIAQAVKLALLHSSTLNDVIADI